MCCDFVNKFYNYCGEAYKQTGPNIDAVPRACYSFRYIAAQRAGKEPPCMTRKATVTRNTRETQITLTLDLDGTGKTDLHTGIGFFDHMLDGFARHGQIGRAHV